MTPVLLHTPSGRRIATLAQPGRAPTIVFLPGLRSDMMGSKAQHLASFCAARDQACLRLDYSGHGASEGAFVDFTIDHWHEDTLAVLDQATEGPLLLVGSSLGGWIALLAALARPARVAALLLIAPAPDFTEDLIWAAMDPAARAALTRDGIVHAPSQYGAPMAIALAQIEAGRRHLLLRGPIALAAPVRILHGQQDADVPWRRSLALADCLTGADVVVTLIKDADHRLSRPADLAALTRVLEGLLATLSLQHGA